MTRPPSARQSNPVVHRPAGSPSGRCRFAWSYFANADLLIAADCTAYAYGDFHRRFMEGRVVLVGCTKLDPVNYVEKLAQIFQANPIRSVTVVRMEVPCCGGMEFAVRQALAASGKAIGCQVVTISTTGEILAVE